jgi:hypothetical protein
MKMLLFFLLTSKSVIAMAAGGISSDSVKNSEKFSLSWSVNHGIGSYIFGDLTLNYEGKNFILSNTSKRSERNTIQVPIAIVGYWVTDTIRIKITDNEVIRSLITLEATDKRKNALFGTVQLHLKNMSSIKKIQVKCEFLS